MTKPSNDNLQPANDNRRDYMRNYMFRRRQGGKTMRQLLGESLEFVAARASPDDLDAQLYIAAVKDLLKEKQAKRGKR